MATSYELERTFSCTDRYRVQLYFMPPSVVENDWFYLLNLQVAFYSQKVFVEKIKKNNHTDDNNDANE